MGKEDTDEKLEQAEIPGGNEADEQQEKEAPKDVRGALRAAIKEQTEKEDVSDDKDNSRQDKQSRRVSPKAKKDEASSESPSMGPDAKRDASERSDKKEETEGSEREVSTKESKEEKLEPVGHWKTKGKSIWDKLNSEAQQEILNREQEVSQGFAQVSQRLKSLEEVEKVLAPRAQTIQQFGATQAQIVDRLFQWMEALGHPNPAIKSQAFKNLAQNFGLNLEQLTPKQQENSEQTNNNSSPNPNEPPQWFGDFTQQVQSEIGTLKQTLDSQKQAAADAFVANWAKDKKYYNDVRQLMGQLLSSGAVPMKGDQLDLDGAYETAIKIHPQVAAQVQQEMSEKAKADAKAKSDQEAKDRAAKLASAKRAGSGLKPAAPFAPVGNSSKLNGKSKTVSVRDSLKAALEEVRE